LSKAITDGEIEEYKPETADWADYSTGLTERGFDPVGCGSQRVVYRPPYETCEEMVVKFATGDAASRVGYQGAAQNAAESYIYYRLYDNLPSDCIDYFNTIYAKDGRDKSSRWLIVDEADVVKRYGLDGELRKEWDLYPINPEVGLVNDELVVIDYGEGVVVKDSHDISPLRGHIGDFYAEASKPGIGYVYQGG